MERRKGLTESEKVRKTGGRYREQTYAKVRSKPPRLLSGVKSHPSKADALQTRPGPPKRPQPSPIRKVVVVARRVTRNRSCPSASMPLPRRVSSARHVGLITTEDTSNVSIAKGAVLLIRARRTLLSIIVTFATPRSGVGRGSLT